MRVSAGNAKFRVQWSKVPLQADEHCVTMNGDGTLTLSLFGSKTERFSWCKTRCAVAAALLAFSIVPLAGCGAGDSDNTKPIQNTSSRANPLSGLFRVNVGIAGTDPQNSFDCWVAATPGQRTEGLSYVSDAEMPARSRKGMVFVYPTNQVVYFYGKDTFVPLDVVFAEGLRKKDGSYIAGVGRIVKIATIDAYQRRLVSSDGPTRFVLEVRRGDLALANAKVGDSIYVPVKNPEE